jgi:hypothetical protein
MAEIVMPVISAVLLEIYDAIDQSYLRSVSPEVKVA